MTEKDEEYMDYQVDLKQTLFANLFWILMAVIVIGFILLSATKVNSIEDETNKLLFLIIWCFATIKLLMWMGAPMLRLKKKEIKDNGKM